MIVFTLAYKKDNGYAAERLWSNQDTEPSMMEAEVVNRNAHRNVVVDRQPTDFHSGYRASG